MQSSEWEIIQLELKYCERCGGLWLRRQGTDKSYCARCSAEMPEFPLRRHVRTRPRLPVNANPEIRGRFDVIRSNGGKGGKA
jgi:hypothetical protein